MTVIDKERETATAAFLLREIRADRAGWARMRGPDRLVFATIHLLRADDPRLTWPAVMTVLDDPPFRYRIAALICSVSLVADLN